MSRPLTGSKKPTARGWQASLPLHRGATRRATWTFVDEPAADRWLMTGRAAIAAGEPLPTPAAADLAAGTGRPAGTSFTTMAQAWCQENYAELWRGGPDRERTVRGHIRRIAAFMDERGLTLEGMRRDQVKALQASLTRATAPTAAVRVPEGLDPEALVTMHEALALPGMASRSTLKRRIAAGALSPAEEGVNGHRYRIADLYVEAVLGPPGRRLRRGPRRAGSMSQDVANDVLWVFTRVCLFAEDHGVVVPQDRKSLKMHRTDRAEAPTRRVVPLATCADIASRLHAVHQLALWLMRILGLRISEAYGIRVEDVIDSGPGHPGVLRVHRQGGRVFRVRDRVTGETRLVDHVDEPKNPQSRRVLVVPPALMALIRVVIAVFHTDGHGAVRADARLIPGLGKTDAAGQGTFRRALAASARTAGVDCSPEEASLNEVFSCTPHDMRRAILSDLDRLQVKDTHTRRFAGHVAGTAVLHRHYLLDDPRLRPARDIAELSEQEVRAELPAGLLVPTPVRCTTGNQQALAQDATRIDVELMEHGWLVVPTDAAGSEPLLGAAEVAAMLDITPKTARVWMEQGKVPSVVWGKRARGAERRSRLADVERVREVLRARVTLRGIADQVGQPYHTVYQYVRAQQLVLEAWGARDYLVPADTAERLRAHYAQQAALHRRAVPLSVAAAMLNVSPAIVLRMVDRGSLAEDERAHDGRRMVTRESIDLAKPGPSVPPEAVDLVAWDDARTMSGLSDAELDALVAAGTLVAAQHRRRRHLTRSSLLRYLVESDSARVVQALVAGEAHGGSTAPSLLA